MDTIHTVNHTKLATNNQIFIIFLNNNIVCMVCILYYYSILDLDAHSIV